MIQASETSFYLFIWAGIGSLAGIGFNFLLDSSLKKFINPDYTKKMAAFYAFSAFRIILVVILIFIAFNQGIRSGLACLLSFIISRWIWIYISAKYYKKKA